MGDLIGTQKLEFLAKTQELADKYNAMYDACKEVYRLFWANEFNSGGANELTTAFLTGTVYEGKTAADFIAIGVTMAEALINDLEANSNAKMNNLFKIRKTI